jgi:serine/threonine protein kinase
MNNQNDQNNQEKPVQPSIDKTFIEGSSSGFTGQFKTPLKPGATLPAGTIPGGANPFNIPQGAKTRIGNTLTGGGGSISPDTLPSGNDPVPLGSGTVVGLLGSGGMAKVYKIWNEKLEVFRAAKILLPNGQADMKNRFETEAKITAKLRHPNIVEIYNVGEWNNLPYIEMEFIDGFSIESIISKYGKLPDCVCSAIAIFVARALTYAHSQEFLIYGKTYQGVIHRDLKPANIMISKSGEIRLMDFGIARPTETSLHTVEGNIVGTMQYLSPEQMDGIDIDCRTDVYSFGAILYEMLTGTKTFPQDTITNLMKKKIMNDYRRFSEFDFDISSTLSRIAQKCLQLNKEDRFSNADALLRDLENAHANLTSDPPAKSLKSFLANPESFGAAKKKSFNLLLSPKVLIPVASLIILGAATFIFLRTDPGKEYGLTTNQNSEKNTANMAQQNSSGSTQNVMQPLQPVNQPGDTQSKPATVPTTPVKQPEVTQVQPIKPPKQPIKQPSNTIGSSVDNSIKTPPQVEPPKPGNSIDRIKQKYNNPDLLAIGKSALNSGNASDAVIALEAHPEGGSDNQMRTLLLFEAYLNLNRTKDALFIANNENPTDAQYDYLCGQLYEKINKPKQALDYYQSALTKPSIIRNRNEIRNDALFSTAAIWSEQYKNNPSAETRIQTLNAWNIVKRAYSPNPDSPRFKRANSELSTIQ